MADPERVGDYLLFSQFASGGMASIHLGRLVRAGFQRVVVVKRLHAEQAGEKGAADRLLREAHLSSRIRSPYVVPTIDVIHGDKELCLVMDLVRGVTLARLLDLAAEERKPLPVPVVTAIFGDVLRGLHAAHEAIDEEGKALHIVHRDVTPRNILVGSDGITRVLDFGIAKALGQRTLTTTGDVRGTLAYMAPEILRGERSITRHADLYSLGVALWEALAGERFMGPDAPVLPTEARLSTPPSRLHSEVAPEVDAVVLRAMRSDPATRFSTAEEMALALEAAAGPPAPRDEVTRTLERLAYDDLERMAERVRECEGAKAPGVTAAAIDPATTTTNERRTSKRGITALAVTLGGLAAIGVVASRRSAPAAPAEPVATATATATSTSTSTATATATAPTSTATATSTSTSTSPATATSTSTSTSASTSTPTSTSASTSFPTSSATGPRVRSNGKTPASETVQPAAPADAGRKDPAADRM